MRAWIDNRKGVGYVVCWLENRTNTPLRCFGQMQSAAMEFRNWLNQCSDERLPRWIKLWGDTFDQATKYTYPDFTTSRPTLRRQKDGEQ